MIVVADTSPLNYLIQIDCIDLLPSIYGRIILPVGVAEELSHPKAPDKVRAWLAACPEWLEKRSAAGSPDPQLEYLGKGEKEAIQISAEINADLLLIDEKAGRLEARRRGLRTTGTLGVLLGAAELGLIDAETAFRKLVAETSFRASSGLEGEFLSYIRSAGEKSGL